MICDPQSAGINLQSPQSDPTPWTLTLIITHIYENHIKFEVSLHFWQIWPTVGRVNRLHLQPLEIHFSSNHLQFQTIYPAGSCVVANDDTKAYLGCASTP